MTAPVSASFEVAEHHCALHPCRPRVAKVVDCPCETVAVLVCEVCGGLLLLLTPGGGWCGHAAELVAAVGGGQNG